MKNLYCLILLFTTLALYSHKASAQEYVRDFGTVANEDFEFSKFESEPDAEAVILFDKGTSSFVRGNTQAFELSFERHLRIKILSNAGIRWAEHAITLYQDGVDNELLQTLEAITFNFENGRLARTELDKATVFDEKVSDNVTVKKFALPGVQKGSIIDIKYNVVSPFVYRLNDWRFQSKIPTLYSYYEARMIPFYEYVFILIGNPKLTLHKSFLQPGKEHFAGADYSIAVNQFATKNVPSFDDEDFFSSEDDYIQRIDFQLAKVTQADGGSREIITTWPKLVSALDKHFDFGKYMDKAEKICKEPPFSDIKGASDIEKLKTAVDLVKNTFSWDGYYGKFATKSPKELVEQKTGSDADINLFLIALLRTLGLDANPVIISTRGHGKVYKDYPFDHFFNYVIAYAQVGEQHILMDATEVHSQYDELPVRCINDQGLLVKNGDPQWVSVISNSQSATTSELTLSFSPSLDSIRFVAKNSSAGHEAMYLRRRLENKKETIHNLYSSDGQQIGQISTSNYKDPSQPYVVEYSASMRPEVVNSKVYFSPFLNAPPKESEFKSASRRYPVDLVYPRNISYVSIVTIPDGYKLEAIPKGYKLDNVLYTLLFEVEETSPNSLKITGKFELKHAVYKPEHYMPIKMANDKAIDLFNQKLAIVPVE
ncbi:MAG: DUF3857 domain-containing protein [Imperialibacter sp.]|uniref:DUF3857 domain-containing protein n=1 Tax=Imperialibacter sp. TaxID=2038411 RepID=UPI0032EC69DA